MSKEEKKNKGTRISISMLKSEKELLDSLAPVLKSREYIASETRSEAIRYCIRAVTHLLIKEIEKERYGGGKK